MGKTVFIKLHKIIRIQCNDIKREAPMIYKVIQNISLALNRSSDFFVLNISLSLYLRQSTSSKYPSKINLTKFSFLFFDIQGIAMEHSRLCDHSNNEEDQKTEAKWLD